MYFLMMQNQLFKINESYYSHITLNTEYAHRAFVQRRFSRLAFSQIIIELKKRLIVRERKTNASDG